MSDKGFIVYFSRSKPAYNSLLSMSKLAESIRKGRKVVILQFSIEYVIEAIASMVAKVWVKLTILY